MSEEQSKFEFDIDKFLAEDCKEENEIGIKMTFSILFKAYQKGLREGVDYGYHKAISDYNERLKAEKVDMLDDLRWEIDQMPTYNDVHDIADYIRQKINTLKENENALQK